MTVTIASLTKTLLANTAPEWAIAGMRANMILYVAKFSELSVAGEALKDLIPSACYLADSTELCVTPVLWL